MQINHKKSVLSVLSIFSIIAVALFSVMLTSAQCNRDGVSSNTGTNGADTITCDGDNDPAGSRVRGRNGNDTITFNEGATGGRVLGGSGNDTITINSSASNVYGQNGNDTIVINGTVNNVNGGRHDDSITVNGTVNNNVSGSGGHDTITVDGTVNGSVNGGSGRDTIVIEDNAVINGRINGNSGSDTLRFNLVLCTIEGRDFDAINTVIEASSRNDTVTIDGQTYQWRSIENFEGNVIPEDCFVPDDTFAGFTDGRLNGLQCAIWIDGNSMTAYDANGADPVVISADMLTTIPASNTLLVQNSANSLRIYHLSSGEIQVGCDVWDNMTNQWKTDDYIFQSLGDYAPAVIR